VDPEGPRPRSDGTASPQLTIEFIPGYAASAGAAPHRR
jgi:hypothetical protein